MGAAMARASLQCGSPETRTWISSWSLVLQPSSFLKVFAWISLNNSFWQTHWHFGTLSPTKSCAWWRKKKKQVDADSKLS